MHNLDLILTITGGLSAALLFGYLTHRLGLSSIVGYLVAGIAVGGHTPGFVADRALAEQLAEVGIILLMFGVGLQFHFKELLAVRRVALPGALCQSAVATLLSCLVARWLGWSWSAGLIYGFAVSVASTVVLLRVLVDNNDLHTPAGHIAVGWLVVEDILTVFLLVILPALFGPGAAGGGGLPAAVGLSLLKLALLVTLTFLAGGRLIPWVLEQVAETRSRELFTLTVLVVALGIAVGAAKIFGVSMALGAFLAGMVVRQSDFSFRAASEALPMRDAFAVLFFVSVGMLFDPLQLVQAPRLVLTTLAVVLLGKPLAALVLVLALGYAPRVAISVAVALGQIGEFSFILASLGTDLGVLGPDAANALVAAAIVSISLNPLWYRLLGPLERWAGQSRFWQFFELRAKRRRTGQPEAEPLPPISRDRAVVIGYGPTGRTLTRLLAANGIEPVVVELNLQTVRELQSEGRSAVYGDASDPEVLSAAGVQEAVALIMTSAGMQGERELIRTARELNPRLRIIARTLHLREVAALREAGAAAVFSGEGEIALNMTDYVMRQLGATDEQIDRERQRIREELPALDRSVEGQPLGGNHAGTTGT